MQYEKKGADDAAATVPEFGVDDWDYTGAFPSISKCVADMAAALAPFSRGGERNGCFEFIGLDFIVTWEDRGEKQVAWLLGSAMLLQVKSTASGLSRAEDLHNEVHRDIITAWVLPQISDGALSPQLRGYVPVKAPLAMPASSRTNGHSTHSVASFKNVVPWSKYEAQQLDAQRLLY